MKKKSISETKSTNGLSTDEIRHIIQHETLNPNIPLVSRNVNAIVQEKWYADKQLSDRTIRSMFKNICVECEIDIKGRNICNHSGRKTCIFELFDLGIPENTGMAITGYNFIGGYRAYAMPNQIIIIKERHFLKLLIDLRDFLYYHLLPIQL
ncbi:hypothetical protein RhiirA1_459933 [Rhizophagus irregularis]|uniref:Uncharacterized protein n=1 Tax=Rhizophagus irregularis TaxID=588596 RepID=A0A2N0RSL9_9GLOM|nr:hypothetical protein RhiirA1_459933 [Rhizophagus irregularis]